MADLAIGGFRLSEREICSLGRDGGRVAAWVLRDAGSLRDFIEAGLRQLDRGVMHFVEAAWRSPDDFDRIDAACDFFSNNDVANRSSRAHGRAFLAATAGVYEIQSIEVHAGWRWL